MAQGFKYEVAIPGKGKFLVESASSLTDEQAYRAASSQAETMEMADPTAGMSGGEKFAAGAGKALVDTKRGLEQVQPLIEQALPGPLGLIAKMTRGAREKLTGRTQDVVQAEVDASRGLDAPLMKTGAGVGGNIAGNFALAVPTMMMPGANTYTGATLLGGLSGLLQPTATGESREMNVGAGTLFGAGGQLAGNTLGRFLKPVQNVPTPARQQLVEEAASRNIPLSVGQATGSRPLQVIESVLEDLPFTSGRQLALKQEQKEAFNRAVGATFGKPESAITPEVAGSARDTLSKQFTKLAERNSLQVTDDLVSKLNAIKANAAKFETEEVGRVISNRIDEFLGKVKNEGGTILLPEGSGWRAAQIPVQISGTAYRKFDSALGKTMRSTTNGDLRHALGELRDAVRGAMDDSISAADQAAWRGARQEYGNLMTVAPLAARSETGDVPGRTLLAAANAANQGARFGAPSELATLGRIGRAFVADQVPNSGTAQRQFYRDLLTSGGRAGLGAGAGAGVAAATGNDPLQGAAIGGGALAAGLLAPRALQSVMMSGPGRAYLTRGLINLSPQEHALLNAMSRAGAMGLLNAPQ